MREGYGNQRLAREGWWLVIFIFISAIFTFLYFSAWFSIALFMVASVGIYLLRNPGVVLPSSPLAVISPVHGRVISIDKQDDPWLSRPATRVVIQNGFWDVHTIRSPVEGKLMKDWSAPCEDPGFNRRHAYWFQTDEGDDIVMSFRLGPYSPYTRMLPSCGDRSGQGTQCGFLFFKGAIALYLPENTWVEVKVGDNVMAGTDIIGTFVHKEGSTLTGK